MRLSMKMNFMPHAFRAAASTAGLLVLALIGAQRAQAGEHRYDVAHATYRAECGSCHVAYPPALLSAPSWNRVLDGLDKHYGSDAGVDAAALKSIREFVLPRAARRDSTPVAATGELPRITTSRWFAKEHRKAEGRWSDPRVKSAANCGACHTQAATGDYSEATLRMPR